MSEPVHDKLQTKKIPNHEPRNCWNLWMRRRKEGTKSDPKKTQKTQKS